ncbi:hypothetical protein B7463_g10927, partial [Scytalidium lignicola]
MSSTPSRVRTRRDISTSRLQRKRETDRLAQRANRERTKQRIERLEEEVKRLRSQDQNAVFLELTQTIENQQKRCAKLEGALLKVLSIIRSTCDPIPGMLSPPSMPMCGDIAEKEVPEASLQVPKPTDEIASDSDETPSEDGGWPTSCIAESPPNPDGAEQSTFLANLPILTDPTNLWTNLATETPGDILTSDLEAVSAVLHQQLSTSSLFQGLSFLPLAADEEKWDVSNDAFLRALQSAASVLEPDHVDPDVPFKAIFSGWHTIEPQERNKPIWTMLRAIDERVFGLWTSKTQKIALMYITHMLVKYRMNPTPTNFENIPSWLRSRPSQDYVNHPLVIDLLLW